MARFYSNENIPMQTVEELRKLGHDVLTSRNAGNANRRVPDDAVLKFATDDRRAVLTHDRKDFVRLHKRTAAEGRPHAGIVVCSANMGFAELAKRIDAELKSRGPLDNVLVRINRPQK